MTKAVVAEPAGVAGSEAPEVVCRMLWSPATYVVETHGEDALIDLCREAKVDRESLSDPRAWISLGAMDRFLAGVRAMVDSDEAFARVLNYRLSDAYGPLRFVLFATTPATMLTLAAQNMRLVTRHSECEVLKHTRTEVSLRYINREPASETDLLCQSRRAQTAAIPTLFGFPDATIDHPRCIARGDGECIYHYRFYTRPARLPTAVGVFVGFIVAAALYFLQAVDWAIWVALPALSGLVAHLYELRSTHVANLAYGDELQQALRDAVVHEAEARGEVFDLHQRQKEWAKMMEEQVAERTASLQDVVTQIRSMGEQRVTSIRGFSHDLRNPLSVLRASLDYFGKRTPETEEVLDDCYAAIDRMEKLLVGLAETARTDSALVRITPAIIDTMPLVERLRRRQRALVYGREIKVSVFRTRETPDSIHTDPLIFERVIDNLCTNAAKYTERGSIVIELDGRPGFLTIKISDTGRGIDPENIDAIFRPEGSKSGERAARSLGLGLSVVVQLMASIGGKIEVMSKPGRGTTFWAHFPEQIPAAEPPNGARTTEQVVTNVVTIRRTGTT